MKHILTRQRYAKGTDMQLIWQDALIGVASISYIVSEAIIIKSKTKKPPVSSAVITACFDFLVCIAFISLGLWFAAITSAVLFVEWTIIGWQSHKIGQNKTKVSA